MFVVCTFYRF
ncbi:hypothetical protein CP8484711_1004, partial [Chlamydia psittaci 84-8471/1]